MFARLWRGWNQKLFAMNRKHDMKWYGRRDIASCYLLSWTACPGRSNFSLKWGLRSFSKGFTKLRMKVNNKRNPHELSQVLLMAPLLLVKFLQMLLSLLLCLTRSQTKPTEAKAKQGQLKQARTTWSHAKPIGDNWNQAKPTEANQSQPKPSKTNRRQPKPTKANQSHPGPAVANQS